MRAKRALSPRQERRLMKKFPSPERTRQVFLPIEEQLRLLKAKTYMRTERGTPVIENEDGTATPMVVALDNWFDYWKALAAVQNAATDFEPADALIAALRQGASYIQQGQIEAARALLNQLKVLYKNTPLEVSAEKFLDNQIAGYMDDDLESHLEKWPELRKEVEVVDNQ